VWFVLKYIIFFKKITIPPNQIPSEYDLYFKYIVPLKKKKATYLRELYHTSKKYILESLIVFFFYNQESLMTDDFVCFHQGLVGNKTNIHTFFFFFFFLISKNYIKLVIYVDIYKSNTSYDNITIYKYYLLEYATHSLFLNKSTLV
jgi:hypothetical protein